MKALGCALGVLVIALGSGGCAHVTNSPLSGFDPSAQTSYRFAPRADKETLLVVTLSGGGTRAAALAFGTLQTLRALPAARDAYDRRSTTLLDQVDIVSSVSGGSVTAGWYALKGPEGLVDSDVDGTDNGRLWKFLTTKLTGRLAWEVLNPGALGRYAVTSYERNDVLADFFAQRLFDRITYAEILTRYKEHANQPYVILNATDLGHEAIFPFTQGRFDLLCSDLQTYRLADAVAASANYPLAFSPLGLKNYSGCAAQRSAAWSEEGPPQYLEYYRNFATASGPALHSYALNEIRTVRLAEDYLQSEPDAVRDPYVHLLDGGVTDNLGVRSTLALEDDPARVPSLYLRLGLRLRPDGYQNIRRVLYVVVNARTHNPGPIDRRVRPPGELASALRMIDTQLDSSTLADQDYLIAELEAMAGRIHERSAAAVAPIVDCRGGMNAVTPPFVSCKPEAQARLPAPDGPLRFYVASVDFEMIPDKACRDTAWLLPTNWGLEKRQVRGLTAVARALLARSPDLAEFYRDTNGVRLEDLFGTPPSLDEACALLR